MSEKSENENVLRSSNILDCFWIQKGFGLEKLKHLNLKTHCSVIDLPVFLRKNVAYAFPASSIDKYHIIDTYISNGLYKYTISIDFPINKESLNQDNYKERILELFLRSAIKDFFIKFHYNFSEGKSGISITSQHIDLHMSSHDGIIEFKYNKFAFAHVMFLERTGNDMKSQQARVDIVLFIDLLTTLVYGHHGIEEKNIILFVKKHWLKIQENFDNVLKIHFSDENRDIGITEYIEGCNNNCEYVMIFSVFTGHDSEMLNIHEYLKGLGIPIEYATGTHGCTIMEEQENSESGTDKSTTMLIHAPYFPGFYFISKKDSKHGVVIARITLYENNNMKFLVLILYAQAIMPYIKNKDKIKSVLGFFNNACSEKCKIISDIDTVEIGEAKYDDRKALWHVMNIDMKKFAFLDVNECYRVVQPCCSSIIDTFIKDIESSLSNLGLGIDDICVCKEDWAQGIFSGYALDLKIGDSVVVKILHINEILGEKIEDNKQYLEACYDLMSISEYIAFLAEC